MNSTCCGPAVLHPGNASQTRLCVKLVYNIRVNTAWNCMESGVTNIRVRVMKNSHSHLLLCLILILLVSGCHWLNPANENEGAGEAPAEGEVSEGEMLPEGELYLEGEVEGESAEGEGEITEGEGAVEGEGGKVEFTSADAGLLPGLLRRRCPHCGSLTTGPTKARNARSGRARCHPP